jgi:hypothetical protein
MKTSPRPWFAPLKKAVLALFNHHVTLRREGGRWRLVYEGRSGSAAGRRPPTRNERAAARDARDLGLACAELARLLDGDAGLRSSLRYLAFVENALEREGWQGLRTVPREVLQMALSQFEEMITNWSAEGLACLRSKMAVAVAEREHEPPSAQAETHAVLLAGLESAQVLAARAIDDAMAPGEEDDDAALLAAYEVLGVAAPER